MVSRKRKGIIGGVTVFLCSAMLLGGTLAWTDFSQTKTNKFSGNVDHDATLHDDFDGENKDVYVENSGDSTIYVRVRLDEYMQIGNTNMLGEDITAAGSVTAKTKDKWIAHKYDQTTIEDCGQNDAANGIQFHSYYTWNMSGRQIKYDPGTPGIVSSVLDGIKKDAGGNPVPDPYGNPVKIVDDTVGKADTLAEAAPVTMAEYIRLTNAAAAGTIVDGSADATLYAGITSGCWILDADGWAYWSRPLAPNTATNLLLDGVTFLGKEPTDVWYYAIDAKLQAVSINDAETTWTASGGCSDSAKSLIAGWKAE